MKVETSGRMCDAVDGGTGGRLTAANVRDVDGEEPNWGILNSLIKLRDHIEQGREPPWPF